MVQVAPPDFSRGIAIASDPPILLPEFAKVTLVNKNVDLIV